MNGRFEQLWAAYLEGELDEAGFDELSGIFDQNPNLVREAADRFEDHRHLGFLLQEVDRRAFVRDVTRAIEADRAGFAEPITSGLPEASAVQAGSGRWLGWGVAAALALVLGIGVLWTARDGHGHGGGEAADGGRRASSVASVVRVQDARWRGGRSWEEGHGLAPMRVGLESGIAVVRFDNGALVALEGPCTLELEAADSGVLHDGRVTVRAPDGAAGFALRTPATDLIDWGTEFSVEVGELGATELHVHEGLVEAISRQRDESRMVQGGEAIRYASAESAEVATVPVTGRTFDSLLSDFEPETQPGRLTVYDGFDHEEDTGTGWTGPWVQGGFWNEAPVVIDPVGAIPAPEGMASSRPGTLVLDPTEHLVVKRMLAEPIDLGADGVVYFSFLFDRPAGGVDGRRWFAFILSNRGDRRVALRLGLHHDGTLAAFARGARQVLSGKKQPSGKPVLFVGKVTSSRDGGDRLFGAVFGADERVGEREPATWAVVTEPFELGSALDHVAISFDEEPGGRVDDIRFGTSWSAVVPSGIVDGGVR